MSDNQLIIGIGASAGGLEALQRLLARLPVSSAKHISFIIAQHISPHHKSLLPKILAAKSVLPVVEATNAQEIAPGVAYVAPPGYNIQVQAGKILLTAPPPAQLSKPSVDLLFRSLAETYGRNAVAITLSGTGNDGLEGTQIVKAHGGAVIVQKPETARCQAMPAAVLKSGKADVALAPEDMGDYIAHRFVQSDDAEETPVPTAALVSHITQYSQAILNALGALGGSAILIVDAAQQIIETYGNIGAALQLPDGEFQPTIHALSVDAIKAEMQNLLMRLVQERRAVQTPLKKIQLYAQPSYVRLSGCPLKGTEDLYMLFIEKLAAEDLAPIIPKSDAAQAALEEELANLKALSHSRFEALQVANLNLQTFNEELQTANEELQVAYAELKQTQQELEEKEQDQQRANKLFKTLFNHTQQGNLLLGNGFKVQLINKRAEELLHQAGLLLQKKEHPPQAFLPEKLQERLLPLLQQTSQSGELAYAMLSFETNEQTLYYEFFINPIPTTDGEQMLALSIIDRTTEKVREDEIFRRDKLLSSLVDSDTNFLIRTNLKGHYTFVNQAFCKKFGYRPEEIIGKHFSRTILPEDYQPDKDQLHQFLALPEGAIVYRNLRKVTAHGERLFTEWEFTAIRNPAGEIVEIQGVGRDITDKHRIAEAARVIEERNAAILNVMQEGIVVQDMSGAIISCNPSAERILGLTAEQMMGRTSIDPRWRAMREDGSPFPGEEHPAMVTLRTGEPQFNALMGVHKPSGEVSWISVNSQLLRHPDTQAPYAVFTMFHDITERKNAELALAAAHKRFESIVDSTDGIVWELDYQTFRFTYVSKKAERLLGYALEEWYQPGFWENHIYPEDREKTVNYCVACSEKLEPHEFEYRFITKDGRTVWLRDIVTVVAANREPTLLRGIMIDITERKKAEERISKQNEILKDIAFTQSHILRRPLANVLGLLNLIDMEKGNAKIEALYEYFNYLLQAAREADEIIHQIVEKTNEMEDE